jgi:hypothetical protein
MSASSFIQRIPLSLRSILLAVGFGAAFVLGSLTHDENAATPERVTGTVIWSNDDNRRIVVEVDGGTREYAVSALRWTESDGTEHAGGYPDCLVATAGDGVRTDRRPVALGVVQVDLGKDRLDPVVVTVDCFA